MSGSASPRQLCNNLCKSSRCIVQPEQHTFAPSKNPRFPTVKVVYCFDSSSMEIFQKPTFRSWQKKHPAPTRLSMASCIWGSEIGVFLDSLIELTKCQCKNADLLSSFLCTTSNSCITPWALTRVQIAPKSNISFMCALTVIHHWRGNSSETSP